MRAYKVRISQVVEFNSVIEAESEDEAIKGARDEVAGHGVIVDEVVEAEEITE